MNQISENELSQFIKDLLRDASKMIAPGQVHLQVNELLPPNIDTQAVFDGSGNYTVYVRPDVLNDEYKISHELLHICVREVVPNFVRVIEPNIIGVIGTELQGYLEHNWILAEQKRRGLAIDEQKLYADIEDTLGRDEQGLQKNLERIITLNNIMRTHPEVLDAHIAAFQKNNPQSLEISQRIMGHYPQQELYANYEARKTTVQAIKEWNKVFSENGMGTVKLNVLLSVTPVFSAAQMKRMAGAIIGVMPNAIVNQQKNMSSHVLYTITDGQTCTVFSMDENGLRSLLAYLNKMTLEEFLNMARVPYLTR